MRKIALIMLISLPIFAGFFPETVHTSISKVEGKTIILKKSFPINGMSGVIIHNYDNKLEAITNRMLQNNSGTVTLLNSNIIHHDKLPRIKTAIESGDKVIGGYLYNNVLLLAPDAKSYAKITSTYNKKWLHPDLFALFLSREDETIPTKKNLTTFAKEYQVGLIYIIRKNSAILLDPISGKIVSKKSISNLPTKGNFPFFMRLDKTDSSWFGNDEDNDYYKIMESI